MSLIAKKVIAQNLPYSPVNIREISVKPQTNCNRRFLSFNE